MAQESMNIALSGTMKEYVLEQVAAGGYSTASEYVRELIRADQKRRAKERLETLLLEGLDGDNSTPLTEQDWKRIRSQVTARSKRGRGK